ncbi:hypothetical protein MUN78_10265 [Leucobacter allii]|uniref:Uncharacterized protein n=1 Tax=Leucobacter allii TaxID=2932247 RepID=A0ABY4FJ85_9MICO|nr:hypothetical protein [Leucobacter allii]UOQ56088.1 hypothetical protein MUN78_10265 [Leucobacter allii]
MSTETRADLDAAIRAHIADEHGDSLTASWVVVAERVPEHDDGMTHVVDIVPDGQSVITTVGLTHYVAQARTIGANKE